MFLVLFAFMLMVWIQNPGLAHVPEFSESTFLSPSPPGASGRQTCGVDLLLVHRSPEGILLHRCQHQALFSSPVFLPVKDPGYVLGLQSLHGLNIAVPGLSDCPYFLGCLPLHVKAS